ncbi:MAG: hypothetical protein JST83_18040 [Bacteroidetes bacterium]|nr:hypothetical protein [Bacteroidota bacterium]
MDLEEGLKELIIAFQAKFPDDGEAYNFLYQLLKQQKRLNVRQCKCAGQHIRTFYKNYRSYFGMSKYTGGSGYPLPDANRSRRFNIPNPLPETLKKPERGVFAECKHCNKRYTITANTIFQSNNTPVRSQLSMLLIAEYYGFDPARGEEVLKSFKVVMANTDLIKSSFSDHKKEESSNIRTLKRYRDLFTASDNRDELQLYNLKDYLK